MKWLKLDCDFRNDPKILSLSQQFGGKNACSFWVLLLCYVGANGMPNCEIQVTEYGAHSLNLLASFLHAKPKQLGRMLEGAAKLGLIDRKRWENDMTISIPNMMKRVDDYTRKVRTKSGECPEKPAVEQNKKKNIEEEQKPPNPLFKVLSDGFEHSWERYPVKDGRKDAERHFSASVHTEQDLTDIDVALTNYLEHLRRNEWKRPKGGKTWFNNWRDWVVWKEPASNGVKLKGLHIEGSRMEEPITPEMQRGIEELRALQAKRNS